MIWRLWMAGNGRQRLSLSFDKPHFDHWRDTRTVDEADRPGNHATTPPNVETGPGIPALTRRWNAVYLGKIG
jgi:hypothetical protein